MCRYRQLQTSNDCQLGELHSDVKLKAFEQERTSMMYEETVRALKEAQLNTEKLQKKLEVSIYIIFPKCCFINMMDHIPIYLIQYYT